MPVAYKRFADIASQMGVDTHGMTDVQAAEAALAAAIRLLRDVGIPERFVDVAQDSLLKNRLGIGPTSSTRTSRRSRATPTSTASPTAVRLGDACTPRITEVAFDETVRPVVEHCMNGAWMSS